MITRNKGNTTKDKVNKAFRELRKKGYTAKQNFWCCKGCAISAFSEEEAKKFVFYTKQEAGSWYRKELEACIYLTWAGDSKEICEVFKANGLEVEHNGSQGKAIVLKATVESY